MKEKFDVRMKTHLSERTFFEEKWQNHASNFHTSFLDHKLQQSNIKKLKFTSSSSFYKFYSNGIKLVSTQIERVY